MRASLTFRSRNREAHIIGDVIDRSAWDNRGNYVDIIGFDVSGIGRTGLYNDGSHCPIHCQPCARYRWTDLRPLRQRRRGDFSRQLLRYPITIRLAIESTMSVGATLLNVPPRAARCMASTMPTWVAIFSTTSCTTTVPMAFTCGMPHPTFVISGNTVFNNGAFRFGRRCRDKPKGNRADIVSSLTTLGIQQPVRLCGIREYRNP